jgi:hypothetical protein
MRDVQGSGGSGSRAVQYDVKALDMTQAEISAATAGTYGAAVQAVVVSTEASKAALVSSVLGTEIAPPRVGTRLGAIGDSRNARSSVPFKALGGWGIVITGITANADGTALMTFSTAHALPVGQPVKIDPDAPVDKAFRNRWFDFTSVSGTSGTLSVPVDAIDRDYLVAAIAAAGGYSDPVPDGVNDAVLTIDAIQGSAGRVPCYIGATVG